MSSPSQTFSVRVGPTLHDKSAYYLKAAGSNPASATNNAVNSTTWRHSFFAPHIKAHRLLSSFDDEAQSTSAAMRQLGQHFRCMLS
jgi:hypothetical protein